MYVFELSADNELFSATQTMCWHPQNTMVYKQCVKAHIQCDMHTLWYVTLRTKGYGILTMWYGTHTMCYHTQTICYGIHTMCNGTILMCNGAYVTSYGL